MRRMNFCEEKGSGMDKIVLQNELFRLPPVSVIAAEKRTRVTIFTHKNIIELSKKDRVQACYQHACLMYVNNQKMTNKSLRDRLEIDDSNYPIASRIIRYTIEENLIKESNVENQSRKFASYIPWWA
jgi:predicted HTH transcriptional regulator